jgi:hypothetical protein
VNDNKNDTLYGWKGREGAITALMVRYAGPGESWSLCPDADVPQDRWPPLPAGDDDAFAAAMREQAAAGNVVDLTPLVASSRGIVFWVPAAEETGGGVFAVLAGIPPEPCGYVLPRGRFAHYRALRAGVPLPPLDDLLADGRRVDLGPRFTPASLCSEAG